MPPASVPPVYSIRLDTYTLDTTPDYAALGHQLDRLLEAHFPGSRLALRGLDLNDHPALSRNELVNTILKLGTDRYNPARKSIHHDHYDPMGVELHAVACEVTDRLHGLGNADYIAAASPMAEFIQDFFESARAERGYPLRLDLLIAYDLDQLVPIPDEGSQGFAFKHPDRKPEALRGIVSILRVGETDPA